jgi:hypothetical protein
MADRVILGDPARDELADLVLVVYLADLLTLLINRHPAHQIGHPMSWAYAPANQVA